MYKFEIKVHIEGNNHYEKNRNTIQIMPEMVDGSGHLTRNISAIFIAIRVSWVGPTWEINYIVGLHISVFTLTCSAVHSLTDTAHIFVSRQYSPLSVVGCIESSRKSVLTACENCNHILVCGWSDHHTLAAIENPSKISVPKTCPPPPKQPCTAGACALTSQ